jgi:glyoxylase-like metal-dependent hydrolase (beta-lactamase superfamily II)
MVSAPVHTLSAGECFGAVTESVRGTLRPRHPDARLLDSIVDAGLPSGSATVMVRPLPQVPRLVPEIGVVEGRRTVRRVASSLTAFVVEHPDATFIVDPGLCRDAATRALNELPGPLRLAGAPPKRAIATADALLLEPYALDFALPTHAHWDHVSGLLDLPDLPVHLRESERAWMMDGQTAPHGGVRNSLAAPRTTVTYELDGPPVATFTASHDLFGDGSVVLVELAGHTPGSVGVLARTNNGFVLLAGDAAWHYEQVDRLRQKTGFPGRFADDDRDAAFSTLHRLHLARHLMRVVPTHDHDAAQQLIV